MRECTIASHLKEWGIWKQNYMITSNTVPHAWMKILFFKIGLEDNNLLHALQNERFDITDQTLKRLCTQLGL